MAPDESVLSPLARRRAWAGWCLFWSSLLLLTLYVAQPQSAVAQSDHGCATSGAVPDPATNAALVADCETLLGLKDTLRGWAPLDWDVETPIWQWEGVAVAAVDGVERVVASLSLWEKTSQWHHATGVGQPYGSAGNCIWMAINSAAASPTRSATSPGSSTSGCLETNSPARFRQCSAASRCWKRSTCIAIGLAAQIPATLGNLTNLRELHLHENQLSGSIPDTLGDLIALEELLLRFNRLSGAIPGHIRQPRQLGVP